MELAPAAVDHLDAMDHAVIGLDSVDVDRYQMHWTDLRIFDSRTKMDLTDRLYGAGYWAEPEAGRIRLVSFFEPLPDSVDILFTSADYGEHFPPARLAPEAGALHASDDGWRVSVERVEGGEYEAWSPEKGFTGEQDASKPVSEFVFRIEGSPEGASELWARDRKGREFLVDAFRWGSARGDDIRLIRQTIQIPLEDIEFIEIRARPGDLTQEWLIEGVRLPELDRSLVEREIRLTIADFSSVGGRDVSEVAPLRMTVGVGAGWRYWRSGVSLGERFRVEEIDLERQALDLWVWPRARDGFYWVEGTIKPEYQARFEYAIHGRHAYYGVNPSLDPEFYSELVWDEETRSDRARVPNESPSDWALPSSARWMDRIDLFPGWWHETYQPVAFLGGPHELDSVDIRLNPDPWYGRAKAARLAEFVESGLETLE